jgi:glycosyltransferase involved in cell wall biosynthesis
MGLLSSCTEQPNQLPEIAMPQPGPRHPRLARPRVTILLSTYNGAAYLKNQLSSFLEQSEVDWHLAWRDDGSTDATCAVMAEFTRRAGIGRCVKSASSGSHIGAAASFVKLLAENQDATFVAFADQDDHWLPEKLRRSLHLLGSTGSTPALYCARQILTDETFNHPTPSMKFNGRPGFPASLTQNIATGNTIVMNQAAVKLVSAIPLPEASNHDWWSYIVVSACGGRVIYDEVPATLYRQHSKNMIGSQFRTASRAIAALQRGPRIYMTMMRRHIERLYEYRHLLHPQAVSDLQSIRSGIAGNFAGRITALSCPSFSRATVLETMLFRFWFLTY